MRTFFLFILFVNIGVGHASESIVNGSSKAGVVALGGCTGFHIGNGLFVTANGCSSQYPMLLQNQIEGVTVFKIEEAASYSTLVLKPTEIDGVAILELWWKPQNTKISFINGGIVSARINDSACNHDLLGGKGARGAPIQIDRTKLVEAMHSGSNSSGNYKSNCISASTINKVVLPILEGARQ